jgi:hypothetical protein
VAGTLRASKGRAELLPGSSLFQIDLDLQRLLVQLVLARDFGKEIMRVGAEQLKANTEVRAFFKDRADFDAAWEEGWADAEPWARSTGPGPYSGLSTTDMIHEDIRFRSRLVLHNRDQTQTHTPA